MTPKQAKFVEVYAGNGSAAARLAGYTGSPQSIATSAGRLLKNAEIAAAIAERRSKEARPLIASRQERQEFWTSVMNGDAHELRDRLKAAELLGRSEADFVERQRHEGADGGPLKVSISINRTVKK